MSLFASRRSALFLAASALAATLGVTACGGGGSNSGTPSTGDGYGWSSVTALKVTDNVLGTGATAAAGSKATVTYSGYLYDVRVADTRGTKFDAGSFQFTLGTTPLQVITGFDQGVTGMKVGGKRTIVIPASLGYGASGYGTIPGGAALVFDVELTAVN